MAGIIENVRKLLLNRNTVTILGVMAGVIALWFLYTATLNKAVSLQTVPIAKNTLTAGKKITEKDIEYVEINKDLLKKSNIILYAYDLIDYYVANGTSIPAGSLFYSEKVVDRKGLVEKEIDIIEPGYKIYWLEVDNTSTYANSIYPGDKIDLWLHATIDNKEVYEEFITSIDVLSVKNEAGQNVFEVENPGEPAILAFAVDNEMWTYLKNIEKLSGLELYPVPKNKQYTTIGAPTEYANQELKAYVDTLVRQFSTNPIESNIEQTDE